MAKTSGIHWIRPPAELGRAIEKYGQRALVAAHAVGANVGAKMQNEARQNAPWHDRTGNARGGLFFAVDGLGQPPVEGSTHIRGEGGKFISKEQAGVEEGPGGDEKTLVIVLGHTMSYGVSLELEHGEAYAIVEPTMKANYPVLEQELKDTFKD